MKLTASDPVLPPAVKQHGRPATRPTRLRSIRAKVAQMANSGEPSHVNANCHTTNDNCVKSRKRLVNCIVRMLILENLISRFENKNTRDRVENSSRIGITKLNLGSADTSFIENRRHRSLLEHRRRQVADVDVIKTRHRGGGAAAAARRRRRVMMLKPAADSS